MPFLALEWQSQVDLYDITMHKDACKYYHITCRPVAPDNSYPEPVVHTRMRADGSPVTNRLHWEACSAVLDEGYDTPLVYSMGTMTRS